MKSGLVHETNLIGSDLIQAPVYKNSAIAFDNGAFLRVRRSIKAVKQRRKSKQCVIFIRVILLSTFRIVLCCFDVS